MSWRWRGRGSRRSRHQDSECVAQQAHIAHPLKPVGSFEGSEYAFDAPTHARDQGVAPAFVRRQLARATGLALHPVLDAALRQPLTQRWADIAFVGPYRPLVALHELMTDHHLVDVGRRQYRRPNNRRSLIDSNMQLVAKMRRAARSLGPPRIGVGLRGATALLLRRFGGRSINQRRVDKGADLEHIATLRQLIRHCREQLRHQILPNQFRPKATDGGMIRHALAKPNANKAAERQDGLPDSPP